MCGQSGSGKTYTTGVLFERLLAYSSLPMMIVDPNSDHVHLGALADPDNRSAEAERYRRVAPSVVEKQVARQYQVECIARTDAVTENYYAISAERRVRHPAVVAICEAARTGLFS